MSNKNTTHLEIERKFLIKYPSEAKLQAVPGAVRYEIEQVYLPVDGERIRMRRQGKTIEYFHTSKKDLTDLTRVEDERIISEVEYRALLSGAGEKPPRIEKVRWCIPHGKLTVEVDIYPFWHKVAVAEIELDSKRAEYSFPDFISVLREVTHDKSFTNCSLAEALRDGKITEPVF